MSPILTRPVREQLEHDRVVRLLQARYKRKTDVIMNPGSEQNQSVTVGDLIVYPDLLLFAEGGKKLLGTIEVETGESVNALEARAEWAVFCKLKVPLHLYVPPTSVDTARRLCAEYDIPVAEVWTFHTTFDQVRFTMVFRSPDAPVLKVGSTPSPSRAGSGTHGEKPKPAAKVATSTARPAPAKVVAKPSAKPKPAVKAQFAAKAPRRNASASKPKAKLVKAKPAKASKPAAKKKMPVRRAGGHAKPAAKKRR